MIGVLSAKKNLFAKSFCPNYIFPNKCISAIAKRKNFHVKGSKDLLGISTSTGHSDNTLETGRVRPL